MLLEICVNSAVSAIEAWKGGASRVELCENMADGGCTPSAGSILLSKKRLTIPVFVMIRPRGADFCYSDDEVELMQEDIRMAKKMGADGLVMGILTPDGAVDTERMKALIALARPLPVTFHRAFDMTRDPQEALDDLIRLGAERVLTSGQARSVTEGAGLIRSLIQRARNRIVVMPGGGIKEHNLAEVIRTTGAQEIHMNLTRETAGNMQFRREGVRMGNPGADEYSFVVTDAERVSRARQISSENEGNTIT